jgi:hypothetical protein
MNFSNLQKCTACDLTLNREDNFDRKATNQFAFQSVCKECSKTIGRKTRKTALSRAVNVQIHNSHKRMLDNALAQKPEVTDLSVLRSKYPDYDFTRLKKMQALNIKINAANDFLIEEQYYYLNPSERPAEGIEYHAELFEERVFEDDNELSTIITEQIDIDDQ